MATGYAYRVFGTPTDAKKWTFSAWCKKGTNSTYHIFGGGATGQTGDGHSYLGLIPEFYANYYDGSNSIWNLYSSADYRDLSGWYHYMFVFDSAQATASNRAKCYINGEQLTSFLTEDYPPLNYSTMWNNSGITHYLGRRGQNQGFEGSLSHVHFCDGYAYTPSDFGSTDSATGEWKINVDPSVSYGNNGFWLFKDDASMTDQSPNSNNFTLSGSITPTQDNPSNVFATLNPLDTGDGADFSSLLSEGNLTLGGSANDLGLRGTLGASSGKFYWEIKANDNGDTLCVARSDVRLTINNTSGTPSTGFWGVQSNGTGASINTYENGTFDNTNALQGFASNTIVGIALDMDNGKMYYSFNGVFKDRSNNSSDPVNQTNPFFSSLPTDGTFIMPYTENRSSGGSTFWNYGNGYFGTTAVSSAGTNASNNGIFEYDVPTGYTALSTKGLNL